MDVLRPVQWNHMVSHFNQVGLRDETLCRIVATRFCHLIAVGVGNAQRATPGWHILVAVENSWQAPGMNCCTRQAASKQGAKKIVFRFRQFLGLNVINQEFISSRYKTKWHVVWSSVIAFEPSVWDDHTCSSIDVIFFMLARNTKMWRQIDMHMTLVTIPDSECSFEASTSQTRMHWHWPARSMPAALWRIWCYI